MGIMIFDLSQLKEIAASNYIEVPEWVQTEDDFDKWLDSINFEME